MNSEQKDLLYSAKLCAEQLLLLINDILDVTKMQENKVYLEKRPFSLYNAMQESLEIISSDAAKKSGIELVCNLDQSLNVYDLISGDDMRLRQGNCSILISQQKPIISASTGELAVQCCQIFSSWRRYSVCQIANATGPQDDYLAVCPRSGFLPLETSEGFLTGL